MDAQETRRGAGVLNRRFFAHNLLACAEGRGAAALYCALTFALALLFARTHAVFGAYPFALAYLAALDRRVPFAYLGALLGALSLGERGYVYAVVYLALLFLRLFLSYPRGAGRYFPPCAEFFEEQAPLRAAAACLGGFFLAIYELLAGGLSTASLAFAGTSLLSPVVLCLLYLGFFESRQSPFSCLLAERERAPGWPLTLSLGALGFSLVRAAETAALFGLSLSFLLAAFLCLLLPRRLGLLHGGAAALLAASAACLSSATVAYLPAFAATAAVSALARRLREGYSLCGAVAAGGLVAYLLTGGGAVLSFFPELLVCLSLTWPLFRSLPRLSREREAAGALPLSQTAAGVRLTRFADAFSRVAAVFAKLSGGGVHLDGGRVRGDRNASFERGWSMTAAMLRDAAAQEEREAREDTAASRRAAGVLDELGARARRVGVYGAHGRQIVAQGVRWEADHPEEGALRRRLEEVCGCRLSAPVLSLRGGVCDLHYRAARRLRLRHYTAGASRGREVSGDAFSVFMGEGERYYALLSDGMGSGQEAAITAGICGAFLSGVLAAGAGVESSLHALNLLLCEREGECGATLDLLEIDLLRGGATFLKCGAAASYIKRGESLFHIPAGRLPIGILPEVQAERTGFDLQAGDCVILLSDGVSQSPEDAFWLCELLSDRWEDEPELMAERILNAARAHAEQSDDMTVALLQVEDEREL